MGKGYRNRNDPVDAAGWLQRSRQLVRRDQIRDRRDRERIWREQNRHAEERRHQEERERHRDEQRAEEERRVQEEHEESQRIFEEDWWRMRNSFLPCSWPEAKNALLTAFRRLQEKPGRFRKGLERVAPREKDDPEWPDIATHLISGTIRNTVFIDTEFGQPPFECWHRGAIATGMPPCYRPNDPARTPENNQLVNQFLEVATFVNWEHAETARQAMIHRSMACPAIGRLVSFSNADGVTVAMDFVELGGCPAAIFEILTDPNIHKVCFNLKADLPVLAATINGFPSVVQSYFDASFMYYLRNDGTIQRSPAGQSWTKDGHENDPKLPVVFEDWINGTDQPPPYDQRDRRGLSSLSSLCEAFTDVALNKDNWLTGWGFDWFLNRPHNFFNSDGKRHRYYALGDAVATVAVYIGSLWVRPGWRHSQDVPASAYVVEWVERQQATSPNVDVEMPPPAPLVGAQPPIVHIQPDNAPTRHDLVKGRFNQYRAPFHRQLRQMKQEANVLTRPQSFHSHINSWVRQGGDFCRLQGFNADETAYFMIKVRRCASQERFEVDRPGWVCHNRTDRKQAQQFNKQGFVSHGPEPHWDCLDFSGPRVKRRPHHHRHTARP